MFLFTNSTCESGKWSCEEKYGGHCSDEVVCPGDTIFMKQTADYDVCEHVCGEKKDAECKKRKINGCYCPEGTYRTQKVSIVNKHFLWFSNNKTREKDVIYTLVQLMHNRKSLS